MGFFKTNPEIQANPTRTLVSESQPILPELTGFEVLSLATEDAYQQNFVMSHALKSSIADLDNGSPKEPPEKWNKIYPNMAVPFTQPLNAQQALFIKEQQDEVKRRQSVLALAPDTWRNTGLGFLGGIVGHMADPVEFGAGYLIGLGVGASALGGRVLGKINPGAIADDVIKSTPQSARQAFVKSFGASFAEGVLGNIAVEPFIAESQSQLLDYEFEDTLISVVGGSLLFAGAIGGVNGLGTWMRNNVELHDAVYKTAHDQMENGKLPNVEPLIKQEIYETSFSPREEDGLEFDGHTSHTYKPIFDTENQLVYAAQLEPTGISGTLQDIKSVLDSFHKFGEELGSNIKTMTSNAFAANAAGKSGKIFRIRLQKMDLFDMRLPLGIQKKASSSITSFMGDNMDLFRSKAIERTIMKIDGADESLITPAIHRFGERARLGKLKGKTLNLAEEALEEAGIAVKIENLTGKQAVRVLQELAEEGKLPATVMDDFHPFMKKQGLKGFVDDGSEVAGRPHSQHNVFHLFHDTQQAKMEAVLRPKKEIIPKTSKNEAQKYIESEHSPQRQAGYNQDISDKVKDRIERPLNRANNPEVMSKEFEDHVARLEAAGDNPNIKKEVEFLKKSKNTADILMDVYRGAISCFRGG